MLVHAEKVLGAPQLGEIRARLASAGAAWVDGRATAGHQGAAVKSNLQLAEDSPAARELGDMVLYPAGSLHRVEPVTRGARLACFFWVQSMVRDDAQRTLLYDMDMAIMRLTRDAPANPALVPLTGCYHNLLRMWADP